MNTCTSLKPNAHLDNPGAGVGPPWIKIGEPRQKKQGMLLILRKKAEES
jgi:hypothetical protein